MSAGPLGTAATTRALPPRPTQPERRPPLGLNVLSQLSRSCSSNYRSPQNVKEQSPGIRAPAWKPGPRGMPITVLTHSEQGRGGPAGQPRP